MREKKNIRGNPRVALPKERSAQGKAGLIGKDRAMTKMKFNLNSYDQNALRTVLERVHEGIVNITEVLM